MTNQNKFYKNFKMAAQWLPMFTCLDPMVILLLNAFGLAYLVINIHQVIKSLLLTNHITIIRDPMHNNSYHDKQRAEITIRHQHHQTKGSDTR